MRTERLQAALLGPRFGGNNDARRDKFLMNEAMRTAGLAAARQIKTGDRAKVRQFLATLETTTPPAPAQQQDAQLEQTRGREVPTGADGNLAAPTPEENSENILAEEKGLGGRGEEQGEGGEDGSSPGLGGVLSVVKPARGCASGSVCRCQGEREAMDAFDKILGTPKYGTPGEFNDEVRGSFSLSIYVGCKGRVATRMGSHSAAGGGAALCCVAEWEERHTCQRFPVG